MSDFWFGWLSGLFLGGAFGVSYAGWYSRRQLHKWIEAVRKDGEATSTDLDSD